MQQAASPRVEDTAVHDANRSIRDVKKIIELLDRQPVLSDDARIGLPKHLVHAFSMEIARMRVFAQLAEAKMQEAQERVVDEQVVEAKACLNLARRIMDAADRVGLLLMELRLKIQALLANAGVFMDINELESLPSWAGKLMRNHQRAISRLLMSAKLVEAAIREGRSLHLREHSSTDDLHAKTPVNGKTSSDTQNKDDGGLDAHKAQQAGKRTLVFSRYPAVERDTDEIVHALSANPWKQFLIAEKPTKADATITRNASASAEIERSEAVLVDSDFDGEGSSEDEAVEETSGDETTTIEPHGTRAEPQKRTLHPDIGTHERHAQVRSYRPSIQVTPAAEGEEFPRSPLQEASANRALMALVSPELERLVICAIRGGAGSAAVIVRQHVPNIHGPDVSPPQGSNQAFTHTKSNLHESYASGPFTMPGDRSTYAGDGLGSDSFSCSRSQLSWSRKAPQAPTSSLMKGSGDKCKGEHKRNKVLALSLGKLQEMYSPGVSWKAAQSRRLLMNFRFIR
jgi:hypothetical protein